MVKAICFEGGEGSGKGTVIDGLEAYLKASGKKVIRTREPGGTKISEQIRNVIVDVNNTEMNGNTETMLFAAARAQLMGEVIKPIIEKYHDSEEEVYLLLDRYVYSSIVYQGHVRGVDIDRVIGVNEVATDGWYPDMTIYLDIAPERGLARIAANSSRECNRLDKETLDFHHKVRNGYLSLAERFDFHVVNADQAPQDVLRDVIKEVTGT